MKVLFLGGHTAKGLAAWLEEKGVEVFYTEDKVDVEFALKAKPDLIISYNYRHILKKDVLEVPRKGAVNLHISYLPYNRGASPNIWSFIEDTPKGVTIHLIDEGVDTGGILFRKEVFVDEEKETLKTSYEKLHKELQELFKENWELISAGDVAPVPQPAGGSVHYKKDGVLFEGLLKADGWDITVKEFKGKIKAKVS